MAEAFAAACGANVVASFCWESILKPVGRQFGYVLCYGSYVKDLEEGVGKLDAARETAQQELKPKERSGKEKTTETIAWETEAKGLSEDAKKFLTADQGQVKWTRCSRSNYFLPNPVWRYWNGRKAYKMAQSAQKYAANVVTETYKPVLHNIVNLDKYYIAFDTRGPLVTRILEALKEGRGMIGVHGLPGVGKTELVKAVANQTRGKIFSDFVVVTVTETPNREMIQQDIGDRLGLKFEAQRLQERALELRHRLEKEEKFLIILDDVWNKLNLVDIGIVFKHPGCKILLASRSKHVLQYEMDVHVEDTFEVPLPSQSEAQACFSKRVGDETLFTANVRDRELECLAIKIVEECARLPLAISTVAGALKGKRFPAWKDALNLLQSSSFDKVYAPFKVSYDFLKSDQNDEAEGDQAQKIFLFCSLHEEDANISIHDLLNLVVGWGLFENEDTLEEARDRLQTLLDKLKSHGLLLNGTDNDDSVKVHDVIRDFGISIASKEPNNMSYIRTNDEMKNHLENDKLKDAVAISLGANYEDQFSLKCSTLRLLWTWRRRSGLGDNFFEETKELRVLCLPGMDLKSMPPTLGFLHNLQALHLVEAELGNIDLIGDLKKLKVLDFRGSDLEELPERIGQLTCLKMLNLSRCRDLKAIPRNVISRLVNLEELNMEDCSFNNWKVHGVLEGQENKVSLDEIKGLTKLTGLHLEVQNSNVLPKGFFRTQLTRFNIALGSSSFLEQRIKGARRLGLMVYKFDISSLLRDNGFNTLLKKSDNLLINDITGLKIHGFELDWGETFGNDIHNISPALKTLKVSNMSDLEYICFGGSESLGRSQEAVRKSRDKLKRKGGVEFSQLKVMKLINLPKLIGFWSEGEISCTPTRPQNDKEDRELSSTSDSACALFNQKVAFPSLESLRLCGLNVKEIWWDGKLPEISYNNKLQKLRKLKVVDCRRLRYLFSFPIANSLKQLEILHVWDCTAMEEFILAPLAAQALEHRIEFSKLKHMHLDHLPNEFIRFYSECDHGQGSSGDSARPFFNAKVVFPSLETLILSDLGCARIWADQLPTGTSYSFQNLKTLKIKRCHRLKYVLSLAIAESLVQLEMLEVRNCRRSTTTSTRKEAAP